MVCRAGVSSTSVAVVVFLRTAVFPCARVLPLD